MRRKLGKQDRKGEWMDWITVVPARRLKVEEITKFITHYRANLTYTNEYGHVIEPVIVLDTANSMLALENENDNSEVGKFVGAVKTAMGCGNVLIVGHLTKALKRAELDAAFRGASAWEADAHGTAVLFRDEKAGCTVMATIKRRFQAKFTELHFTFQTETQIVENELEGEREELTIGYCTMEPGEIGKRQEKAEAKEESETQKIMGAAVNILQMSKFLPDDEQFMSPSKLVKDARKVVTSKDTNGKVLSGLIATLRDDDRFLTVRVTPEERVAYKLNNKFSERVVLKNSVHGVTDVPMASQTTTPSTEPTAEKLSSDEIIRRFFGGQS
jgi:hypothetical protein